MGPEGGHGVAEREQLLALLVYPLLNIDPLEAVLRIRIRFILDFRIRPNKTSQNSSQNNILQREQLRALVYPLLNIDPLEAVLRIRIRFI